jgi:hypothetical protein
MGNVYFDLTLELNRGGTIALLTSGQAVVHYRPAIMSKDGDWVLRETPEACSRVLSVLGARGARYRPGAPLDVRWLAGGWSSHLEFQDDQGRRIRCDFLTRPPRVETAALKPLFEGRVEAGQPQVVDLVTLIRMKRTQRAKDYPVIGELARLLPPELEVRFTTDPDRILALAGSYGKGVDRLPVEEAFRGASREQIAVALARETYRFQEEDRKRLEEYERAARPYLERLLRSGILDRTLPDVQAPIVALAEEHLPFRPSDPPAGKEGSKR